MIGITKENYVSSVLWLIILCLAIYYIGSSSDSGPSSFNGSALKSIYLRIYEINEIKEGLNTYICNCNIFTIITIYNVKILKYIKNIIKKFKNLSLIQKIKIILKYILMLCFIKIFWNVISNDYLLSRYLTIISNPNKDSYFKTFMWNYFDNPNSNNSNNYHKVWALHRYERREKILSDILSDKNELIKSIKWNGNVQIYSDNENIINSMLWEMGINSTDRYYAMCSHKLSNKELKEIMENIINNYSKFVQIRDHPSCSNIDLMELREKIGTNFSKDISKFRLEKSPTDLPSDSELFVNLNNSNSEYIQNYNNYKSELLNNNVNLSDNLGESSKSKLNLNELIEAQKKNLKWLADNNLDNLGVPYLNDEIFNSVFENLDIIKKSFIFLFISRSYLFKENTKIKLLIENIKQGFKYIFINIKKFFIKVIKLYSIFWIFCLIVSLMYIDTIESSILESSLNLWILSKFKKSVAIEKNLEIKLKNDKLIKKNEPEKFNILDELLVILKYNLKDKMKNKNIIVKLINYILITLFILSVIIYLMYLAFCFIFLMIFFIIVFINYTEINTNILLSYYNLILDANLMFPFPIGKLKRNRSDEILEKETKRIKAESSDTNSIIEFGNDAFLKTLGYKDYEDYMKNHKKYLEQDLEFDPKFNLINVINSNGEIRKGCNTKDLLTSTKESHSDKYLTELNNLDKDSSSELEVYRKSLVDKYLINKNTYHNLSLDINNHYPDSMIEIFILLIIKYLKIKIIKFNKYIKNKNLLLLLILILILILITSFSIYEINSNIINCSFLPFFSSLVGENLIEGYILPEEYSSEEEEITKNLTAYVNSPDEETPIKYSLNSLLDTDSEYEQSKCMDETNPDLLNLKNQSLNFKMKIFSNPLTLIEEEVILSTIPIFILSPLITIKKYIKLLISKYTLIKFIRLINIIIIMYVIKIYILGIEKEDYILLLLIILPIRILLSKLSDSNFILIQYSFILYLIILYYDIELENILNFISLENLSENISLSILYFWMKLMKDSVNPALIEKIKPYKNNKNLNKDLEENKPNITNNMIKNEGNLESRWYESSTETKNSSESNIDSMSDKNSLESNTYSFSEKDSHLKNISENTITRLSDWLEKRRDNVTFENLDFSSYRTDYSNLYKDYINSRWYPDDINNQIENIFNINFLSVIPILLVSMKFLSKKLLNWIIKIIKLIIIKLILLILIGIIIIFIWDLPFINIENYYDGMPNRTLRKRPEIYNLFNEAKWTKLDQHELLANRVKALPNDSLDPDYKNLPPRATIEVIGPQLENLESEITNLPNNNLKPKIIKESSPTIVNESIYHQNKTKYDPNLKSEWYDDKYTAKPYETLPNRSTYSLNRFFNRDYTKDELNYRTLRKNSIKNWINSLRIKKPKIGDNEDFMDFS